MKYTHLLISICFLCRVLLLQAQPQPNCVAEKLKGTMLQYKGRIELADGRTAYKFTSKDKDCNNCPFSVEYTDDDCILIASFTLFCKGCDPVIAINDSFTATAFPEGQKGFYADYINKNKVNEKKDNEPATPNEKAVSNKPVSDKPAIRTDTSIVDYTFRKPVEFTISSVVNTTLALFKLNDQLLVHLPVGLKHYRNNKILNQYKLEPREVTEQTEYIIRNDHVPPYRTSRSILNKRMRVYFMGGSIKRFLKITPTALMVSRNTYVSYGSQVIIQANDWVKQYSLIKKKP